MPAYILHQNRYWTEYLDFLIEDSENFSLIASQSAVEDYDSQKPLSSMPLFDPQKHRTIITAGRLHDETDQNFIIMRFQHSPGFYVAAIIKAYSDLMLKHRTSDYRILVQEEYYRALMLRELRDPAFDHFRYEMINDPKVEQIQTDLMMYKIRDAQRLSPREMGTALLSLTWLMIDEDLSIVKEILRTLNKELKVDLLLHPLMRIDPGFMAAIRELEGSWIRKIYYNLPRNELIGLYDAHEFIVSDGSGSCYEALLRGCKPIAIKHLRKNNPDWELNEELEEIYLPFPSYREIATAPAFDSAAFIARHFPYLQKYSPEEARLIAKKEITDLLKSN